MGQRKSIVYRAVTGLFLLGVAPGAVMNLLQPAAVVEITTALGIPLALLSLLGVWKLLGIAAIVTPGVWRLKEWAYAGFFFDLTGAAYLHAAAGDYPGAFPALMLAGLLLVSYRLRPWAGSVPSGGLAQRPSAVVPRPVA